MNEFVERLKGGLIKELYREYKWIYKYASAYRKWIYIYILMGIVAAALTLASSIYSKNLVDAVTTHNSSGLAYIICMVVVMGLASIAISAVMSRVSAVVSLKVNNEIRRDIYNKMLHTDLEFVMRYHSGDLLNRLTTDASSVANSTIGWIPSLITRAVQFLGAAVVICFYDPALMLIVLISAPVSALMSRVFVKKLREHNKKVLQAGSEILQFEQETFQNIQSIKAFDLMGLFSHKLIKVQKNYTGIQLNYNKFSVITTVLLSLLSMIVSYACFGWGAYRLWVDSISIGTMVLFLQLASYLASALSSLVGLIPSAISAATSAGRIIEVIEQPAEKTGNEQQAENLYEKARTEGLTIELSDLGFSYMNSDKPVLENVNLKAESGEIVALVGQSGSGKTTLVRILLGLICPEKGKAMIYSGELGMELCGATRRIIAYVPQENAMFAGSIAENMRMVKPDAADEEIKEALKTACALEFVQDMKDGIYSNLGERGTGISEGQIQRLCIARAVLRNAPVLILDEATSALDMETEQAVLKNIMKADSKRICIVTTHRPSVLRQCSRVYRIENKGLKVLAEEEIEKLIQM